MVSAAARYAERFVRSIRTECLDHLVLTGETSLRRALESYVEHYHLERNHQGLDNRVIDPGDLPHETAGPIRSQERLGGLLCYYHRETA